VELVAVHLGHRGEEAAGGAQQADGALHAVADGLVGLLGGGLEAELVALPRRFRHVVGGEDAGRRGGDEQRPRQPAPADPSAVVGGLHPRLTKA
jgi:hypothetical protein